MTVSNDNNTWQTKNHVLSRQDITSALVREGHLLSQDSERVLQEANGNHNLHPLEIIASYNFVDQQNVLEQLTLEKLTLWLARKSNHDYYHIDPLSIDIPAITKIMSYGFAKRHAILAVAVYLDIVDIVSAQPFVIEWQEDLQQLLGKKIRRKVANPAHIRRYINEFYHLDHSVNKAVHLDNAANNDIHSLDNLLEFNQEKTFEANDQHVVRIVDWLLQYAIEQQASDIHIEPKGEKCQIRFRIDGILHVVYQLPGSVFPAMISRLKILSRMDVSEKRRPQNGRLKTKGHLKQALELRLSTLPTGYGEKMVLRLFDPAVLVKDFSQLGLQDRDYQCWHELVSHTNGIILVTGPTGSGKTTTLYSTLKYLAQPAVNVCTIEDPVEMLEPSFNQMQVHESIDLTFAEGMRSLLRQDPDIIMIGEIRDVATAEMAIQAALTGHLVISSLHTNDAVSAITRLLELGIPAYLLRATLLGVMAQRLVRTLCHYCKQTKSISQQDWDTLVSPWEIQYPDESHAENGCIECRHTGYKGRVGIYEVLKINESIQEMIQDHVDSNQLRQQAYLQGMYPMVLSGAQQIINGNTTLEEVMRVAPINYQANQLGNKKLST